MFTCRVLFSHKLYFCAMWSPGRMHPLVNNETNQELKRCRNLFLSVVTGIRIFSIIPRIYWELIRCRFPSPHAQLETGAEIPGPGPGTRAPLYMEATLLVLEYATYCSPEWTLTIKKEIFKVFYWHIAPCFFTLDCCTCSSPRSPNQILILQHPKAGFTIWAVI